MLSLFSEYHGRILDSAGFVLAEVGPASVEVQSPLLCSVLLIFEHVARYTIAKSCAFVGGDP